MKKNLKPKPACIEHLNITNADNYYEYSFHCNNCNHGTIRYICKGTLVKNVETLCGNCGCIIKG